MNAKRVCRSCFDCRHTAQEVVIPKQLIFRNQQSHASKKNNQILLLLTIQHTYDYQRPPTIIHPNSPRQYQRDFQTCLTMYV